MASVAQLTEVARWIDKSLDYLTSNWEAIPAIAAEWGDWDELDRLDLIEEWSLREDRLHQLQRWREDGLLSAEQLERFRQVEVLIEQHRATLQHLFEN